MSIRFRSGMILALIGLSLSVLLSCTQTQSAAQLPSKPELAKAVLVESGIASQYDLYLRNGVELAAPPKITDRFINWIHQLLIQEAGWQQVESQYRTQIEASFSAAELKDMQKFFQRPVVKKLLQVETQSYLNTSPTRRALLLKVWDAYNLMTIDPSKLSSAPPSPEPQELAESVLVEARIGAKYDRYLRNAVEFVTLPGQKPQFLTSLQRLLAQEAGWKQVRAQYLTQMNSSFSRTELEELTTLVKQPLLKKLLQVDAQTYAHVAPTRHKLIFKVWDGYQQGKYGNGPK